MPCKTNSDALLLNINTCNDRDYDRDSGCGCGVGFANDLALSSSEEATWPSASSEEASDVEREETTCDAESESENVIESAHENAHEDDHESGICVDCASVSENGEGDEAKGSAVVRKIGKHYEAEEEQEEWESAHFSDP